MPRPKSLDKRLQSERRKEMRKVKSKEAARCRRGKEGEVFADLLDKLPVPENIKKPLDKSSVIRLIINYIKTQHAFQDVFPDLMQSSVNSSLVVPLGHVIDDLQDIVFLLSASTDIIHVTDSLQKLMGICQYDVIGHSIESFVHPADWLDVEAQLRSDSTSISFTARFRCSLSHRGRGTNMKSSIYKTLRFSGQCLTGSDIKYNNSRKPSAAECFILTAKPVELEQPWDSSTFITKHSLDMKFLDSDQLVTDLTRYPEGYMKGKSMYNFIHSEDLRSVEPRFKSLYSKDSMITDTYRFLTFGGGYVRMVTQASLINDNRSGKPKHIICAHHAVSQIEESDVVLDEIQMIHKSGVVKVENQSGLCKEEEKENRQNESLVDEEVNSYDNIMITTASCFVNAEEEIKLDKTEADVFSHHVDTDLPTSAVSTLNDIVNLQPESSNVQETFDFEALIAKLDNDEVDMSSGLFADLPDLADDITDEKFYLRAPYFHNDDCANLPFVDNESCFAVDEVPSPRHDVNSLDNNSYRHCGSAAFGLSGDFSGSEQPSPESYSSPSSYQSPSSLVQSPTCTEILDVLDLNIENSSPEPDPTVCTSHVFSPGGGSVVIDIQAPQTSLAVDTGTLTHCYTNDTSRMVHTRSSRHLFSNGYNSQMSPTMSQTSPTMSQRHCGESLRKRKVSQVYSNIDPASSTQSSPSKGTEQKIPNFFTELNKGLVDHQSSGFLHATQVNRPVGRVTPQVTAYLFKQSQKKSQSIAEDPTESAEVPAKRSNRTILFESPSTKPTANRSESDLEFLLNDLGPNSKLDENPQWLAIHPHLLPSINKIHLPNSPALTTVSPSVNPKLVHHESSINRQMISNSLMVSLLQQSKT